MKKSKILLTSAFALLAFASSNSVRAQQVTGFNINRFEPSERGSEWFVLESLDFRGHVRPMVGLVGEWAYRPLAIYNTDGTLRTAVVRHQLFVHPGASFLLWNRLRLAASLPVALYADGQEGTLNGSVFSPPANKQTVGDLRLGADVRLFGEHGDVITGVIGMQVWAPTGDKNSYAGDGKVRLAPRALVAGDVGVFTYAAKLGFQYRDRNETFGGAPIGSEFFFAASAGVRVLDKKLVVGPEFFGSSVTTGDQFFAKKTTPLEAILGAHYTVANDWRIGAGVGAGLTRGYGSPTVRTLLNVEWVPAVKAAPTDRDGDGVFDNEDACIDVKGVRTTNPKTNGCPPPAEEPDQDKDGIYDKDDACIDVPGVKTDDPKTNGCPPDQDKDGIYDKDDACIDVPGVKTDDPKTNGCPPDRDKDGIYDKDDACPDTPGVKSDDPKKNGCPVDPDRDKDGIPNEQDACPDEPGKPNPDPKKNGCPQAYVDKEKKQIIILQQVRFATNSAAIVPGKDSLEVLEAVFKVLKDHVEITKIRIEGHTDNRGSAAYNKDLSARRAASVVKWLTQHGIEASRLSSAGFGLEKPIDTNDTDIGRQANRRVEFHIEAQTESK